MNTATKPLHDTLKKVQVSQAAAAQSRSLAGLTRFQLAVQQRWANERIEATRKWIKDHRRTNTISFATWQEAATLLGESELMADACQIELARRGAK